LLGQPVARSLAAATDVDVVERAILNEGGDLIVGDLEQIRRLIERQQRSVAVVGVGLAPLHRLDPLRILAAFANEDGRQKTLQLIGTGQPERSKPLDAPDPIQFGLGVAAHAASFGSTRSASSPPSPDAGGSFFIARVRLA
jgi:hypothetical protein